MIYSMKGKDKIDARHIVSKFMAHIIEYSLTPAT